MSPSSFHQHFKAATAMSAGKHDEFNDAISFSVYCRTQKEADRYWNAILKNGGKAIACGSRRAFSTQR